MPSNTFWKELEKLTNYSVDLPSCGGFISLQISNEVSIGLRFMACQSLLYQFESLIVVYSLKFCQGYGKTNMPVRKCASKVVFETNKKLEDSFLTWELSQTFCSVFFKTFFSTKCFFAFSSAGYWSHCCVWNSSIQGLFWNNPLWVKSRERVKMKLKFVSNLAPIKMIENWWYYCSKKRFHWCISPQLIILPWQQSASLNWYVIYNDVCVWYMTNHTAFVWWNHISQHHKSFWLL